MKGFLGLLFLLLLQNTIYSQFFYTVGFSPVSTTLFYSCQEDQETLTLYGYNIATHEHQQLISRFYLSAGFCLLPDQSGFSFIHNDSVYIKYFAKRGVKRIEFYEPIYAISSLIWLDSASFCFSAREHGSFNIYKANLEGDIERLIYNDASNFFYPQYQSEKLFYIARTNKGYSIESYGFKTAKTKELCLLANNLSCLSMVSKIEGFFLSYQTEQTLKDECIEFGYYSLKKASYGWQTKKLFSFKIPTKYLTEGPERLYESITPFLPRFDGKDIYFIDYITQECSKLKKYSLVQEKEIPVDAKKVTKNFIPGVFTREEFFKGLIK